MLFRFRSFYGKIITFALVALVFFLYIKVIQVDEQGNNIVSSFENVASFRQSRHRHGTKNSESNENENEIQRPPPPAHKPDTDTGESYLPYESEILRDLSRQEPGLGDNGEAAYLVGEARIRGEQIYKKIALNEELSEHLSYNRTLADYRHPQCLKQHYSTGDLTASIVIIFFNEPYSVLLRTVHSSINTCNGNMLKQIILVDDGSTNEELHDKLDYYIRTRFPPGKVIVVRLKNR